VGKASRSRQLKKDKERQRRRAAQATGQRGFRPPGSPRSGAGPSDGSGTAGFGWLPGQRSAPSQRELVAVAVGEATRAVCRGDRPTFDTYLELLATEKAPGWTQTVSREIAGFFRSSVTAAWRHGWQPAELARHAGRELGDRHASMTADMIADEMRGYAAATVDDRWAAQVAPLDDGSWRGSDADYLGAWQGRQGRTGKETVATAIELLHLLQHLPVLERLCPLPGTAHSGSSPAHCGADERILSKIRALLAKAESTEFPEEAEALSARVQELMAKYSIDQAVLAAQEGRKGSPAGRRLPVDNPYESPKASLLQTIAKANRCRTIWHKELGMSTVVGFPADLDAVELLFTSLLVQANTAMLRAGAKRDAHGRSRTRAFRQSFLIAYAIRIGERLSQATEHAEQQAATASPVQDLLPVLKVRQQAVDDAIDEMFGDTVTSGRAMRATDAEGWYSGRAAADLAALQNHGQVTA
jgi:hypothetical protein